MGKGAGLPQPVGGAPFAQCRRLKGGPDGDCDQRQLTVWAAARGRCAGPLPASAYCLACTPSCRSYNFRSCVSFFPRWQRLWPRGFLTMESTGSGGPRAGGGSTCAVSFPLQTMAPAQDWSAVTCVCKGLVSPRQRGSRGCPRLSAHCAQASPSPSQHPAPRGPQHGPWLRETARCKVAPPPLGPHPSRVRDVGPFTPTQ